MQRRPLARPAGVQIGRLLQAVERGVEVLRRRQEPHAQPRRQHLREGALVDPGAAAHEAAGRPPLAGIVGQLSIGIVLEQHHVLGPARLRQSSALLEAPAPAGGVLKGRGDIGEGGGGIRTPAARRHGLQLGAEEAEHLQGGQIGRRLHRDRGCGVHAKLGDQVDPLLGARQHQHPLRRAVEANGGQLLGDPGPEVRLPLAPSVLQQAPGRSGERDVFQRLGRRQPPGEGDHARLQRGLQHRPHRRAVQVLQARGQSRHGASPFLRQYN